MMVDLKPNMSVIILNKNAVHMSFIKQRQENGFLIKVLSCFQETQETHLKYSTPEMLKVR